MEIEGYPPSKVEGATLTTFIQHFTRVMADIRPPGIEAFGIGGSFGNQSSADDYSDIDLFLLVSDSFLSATSKSIDSFIGLFGNYLLSRGPIFVANYGYSISVLYEPLMCCQFNLNSRRTLTRGPIRKHTKVLDDATGFYTQFTEQEANATVDKRAIFTSSCSFFWFRVINVCRDLARGHHWFALRHLGDVQQQLFILLRLKYSKEPADFAFAEKNLEQDIGLDICGSLAPILAGYDAKSIRAALKSCVDWYSKEAPAYAATINAVYPNEAASRIIETIVLTEDNSS